MKRIAFGLLLLLSPLAFAQGTNTATIEFTRPTKFVDGTDIPTSLALSFRVWQGVQGQPKTLAATITNPPGSVTTGLLSGTTYCWEVSTVATGYAESARSNEACKTFPQTAAQTVTITVR